MKVKSKLTDLDFQFGSFEYKKDHLIIHSDPKQPMEIKVYVSPDDVLSAIGKALSNPMVWVYMLGFPVFLMRYRKRKKARMAGKSGNN